MRVLYFDCGMGAAGDMLTAALLELMPDPEGAVEKLNAMGIPHVEFVRENASKCGVSGIVFTVVCCLAFVCARWVNLPALLGSLFVR